LPPTPSPEDAPVSLSLSRLESGRCLVTLVSVFEINETPRSSSVFRARDDSGRKPSEVWGVAAEEPGPSAQWRKSVERSTSAFRVPAELGVARRLRYRSKAVSDARGRLPAAIDDPALSRTPGVSSVAAGGAKTIVFSKPFMEEAANT